MESGVGVAELLIIVLGLGGLAVGTFFLWKQNKAKSARTQAMFGVGPQGQAEVLSKRTYQWPDRLGYYVTFQAGGAQPVEVEVSPEWYQYLNPGDRGALTVQGGQFGGFNKVG